MKSFKEKITKALIPSKKNNFRPGILQSRSLFVIAVILLAVKFLIFSWFLYFPYNPQFAIVVSDHLISLVNAERQSVGASNLVINEKLTEAARQKANDMIANNYFAHTSPSGVTPWYWLERVGYSYTAAGENLAMGFNDSQILHNAWMNSSLHRANILSTYYNEIGIAVAEGEINGTRTVIAVQFFGSSCEQEEIIFAESAPEDSQSSELAIVLEEEAVEGETIENTETCIEEQVEDNETTEKRKFFFTSIIEKISEKTELFIKNFYFLILGFIVLILLLTIFINIRIQYPKTILHTLVLILFIAAIALFNVQDLLNAGLKII